VKQKMRTLDGEEFKEGFGTDDQYQIVNNYLQSLGDVYGYKVKELGGWEARKLASQK